MHVDLDDWLLVEHRLLGNDFNWGLDFDGDLDSLLDGDSLSDLDDPVH